MSHAECTDVIEMVELPREFMSNRQLPSHKFFEKMKEGYEKQAKKLIADSTEHRYSKI